MFATIQTSAKCEIRSVIRFLQAEGNTAAEIHRRVCAVYGENIMSDSAVRKWCRIFQEGRTDVHDEGGQGRKSVATDDIVEQVNKVVRERRRFTISELSADFPAISRSALYNIVAVQLNYHKFCARWVPKQLTDVHKAQRMSSALTFLQRYSDEGAAFLGKIVTGDETWVQFVNAETKEQSKQWMHTNSPNKPKKFKQTLSNRKLMATVFWDCKGPLLVEFMDPGTTITAATYCETLKRLRRAIQNKRRGKLSSGIVLLHDNARPHTARTSKELLENFGWELFDHPPYSPDLAPSDFHLFTKMKVWLGQQRFNTNEELKTSVQDWLTTQAATWYEEGIQKLVPRYDKCLNIGGDYVEK